jgi:[ribosomal protein S5]-alanine N-acetyltransferase
LFKIITRSTILLLIYIGVKIEAKPNESMKQSNSKNFATDFEKNGIRIFALDVAGLRLFLENKPAFLEKYQLQPQILTDTDELMEISTKMCLPNMQIDPEQWPFFTRWMAVDVENDQKIVAELLLISGLDSSGAVEIGYGVTAGNDGYGFMTKTIACFLSWATENEWVKRIKAETNRSNLASIRVLEKNDFKRFVELEETIWWVKNV